MSSKAFLPSLSVDGWVNSSIKTADYLFSHIFLSDYSQTYLYTGFVTSLAWIIQATEGNMAETIRLTQLQLGEYFTRYFNNVVVEVTEVENIENPSKGQISIYLRFTDTENKEYVLGKLLTIIDSKITEVVNINNG